MKYYAIFYVVYIYYLPHFTPIAKELLKRGKKILYVFDDKENSQENISIATKISEDKNCDYKFGTKHLFSDKSSFVFFANTFKQTNNIKAKTVFLEHGIGTKSTSFYSSIIYFDFYLVEGEFKYNRLKELYPEYEYKIKQVGFSKFDNIKNISQEYKSILHKKYKIDTSKKTILYSPTFFPSSIEKMSLQFPNDFKDCNIIVKAHHLTHYDKKYKKQRAVLEHWKGFENCEIVKSNEYDLTPFLSICDVMISDESSCMFEFASLNKPVISNRYFKLRWSYYLFPWKLAKRIDKKKDKYRQILDNATSYKETLKLTKKAINSPLEKEDLRVKFSKEICGEIDGKVSIRIADILGGING